MKEYNKLDQQIHQLSQTIAKFNRSFVPAVDDDSHTNLGFDFIGRHLWGRWAHFDQEVLIAGFDLQTKQFVLVNKKYQTAVSFSTVGKTQSDVEEEIAGYLTKSLQADGPGFLKAMHYEIPDYGFKEEIIKQWKSADLNLWIKYRHLANEACALLANHLNKTVAIRIWPHHFDTGIYMELNEHTGVGFGWAMADDKVEEGYFYFSAYGLNGHKINYDTTGKLAAGRWITGKEWNGAVLGMSVAHPQNIVVFLREVSQWIVSQTYSCDA